MFMFSFACSVFMSEKQQQHFCFTAGYIATNMPAEAEADRECNRLVIQRKVLAARSGQMKGSQSDPSGITLLHNMTGVQGDGFPISTST